MSCSWDLLLLLLVDRKYIRVCMCVCVCVCVKMLKVLIAQSYLSLCNPMDSSPAGSSVHEFFRQENCSGLPFPSPGDFPNPGIEPGSPALQEDSLQSEPPGKPHVCPSRPRAHVNSSRKPHLMTFSPCGLFTSSSALPQNPVCVCAPEDKSFSDYMYLVSFWTARAHK